LDWALVLILEVVIASVAVSLIIMSLKTFQVIRYLGVGKSFWMPVAISGFLFFFGSVVAILFELNFSLTEYTDEVVQTSRFLALCILVGGVYTYSRKVTKSLGGNFVLPQKDLKADKGAKMGTPIMAFPIDVHERLMQENFRKEPTRECKHRFGYLQTLQIDVPIPDECLSCDRIIECKHSQTKTNRVSKQKPDTGFNIKTKPTT
jgi:hypothetical protein